MGKIGRNWRVGEVGVSAECKVRLECLGRQWLAILLFRGRPVVRINNVLLMRCAQTVGRFAGDRKPGEKDNVAGAARRVEKGRRAGGAPLRGRASVRFAFYATKRFLEA